ncbi:hypothetical protein [Streptosporangium canum]|uniref:hypothetical protein n=1 Tax=Streptosporangium canum TaxID=324952 RepID=UPI0037B317A5
MSVSQRLLATRLHHLMKESLGSYPADGVDDLEVWILHHTHKHGDEVSVHASRSRAEVTLAEYVRTSWDNIVGRPDMPGIPDQLSNTDAIKLYFRHRGGSETYSIFSATVDGLRLLLPAPPAPAALYCRLCHRQVSRTARRITAVESGTNPMCCDGCWDERLN